MTVWYIFSPCRGRRVRIKELAQDFTSTSFKSLRGKLQCSSLQIQCNGKKISKQVLCWRFHNPTTLHAESKKHYSVRPSGEKWACAKQSLIYWTKSSDTMQWWAYDFHLFLFLQETQSSGPQLLSEICPAVISPGVLFHSDTYSGYHMPEWYPSFWEAIALNSFNRFFRKSVLEPL